MIDWRAWFLTYWPNPAARREIVAGYAYLRQHPRVLADIALRCSVWTPIGAAIADPYRAGVHEGRRQAALEILRLANTDLDRLYRLVEPPNPTKGRPHE